jgi:hypothetical protein
MFPSPYGSVSKTREGCDRFMQIGTGPRQHNSSYFFFFICGSISENYKRLPSCSPPSVPILRYLSPINNSHLSYVILYAIFPSSLGSPLRSFLMQVGLVCFTVYLLLFLPLSYQVQIRDKSQINLTNPMPRLCV